jgi:hypothetical protein
MSDAALANILVIATEIVLIRTSIQGSLAQTTGPALRPRIAVRNVLMASFEFEMDSEGIS